MVGLEDSQKSRGPPGILANDRVAAYKCARSAVDELPTVPTGEMLEREFLAITFIVQRRRKDRALALPTRRLAVPPRCKAYLARPLASPGRTDATRAGLRFRPAGKWNRVQPRFAKNTALEVGGRLASPAGVRTARRRRTGFAAAL